jgi:hypothetical protein
MNTPFLDYLLIPKTH